MARDAVANFVYRLLQCRWDPRRVGPDEWESRCPGHNSQDHALSITRDEKYGVMLRCRSSHRCLYGLIRRKVALLNVHAETPDGVLRLLSTMEIQPSLFNATEMSENHDTGTTSHQGPDGSDGPPSPPPGNATPHVDDSGGDGAAPPQSAPSSSSGLRPASDCESGLERTVDLDVDRLPVSANGITGYLADEYGDGSDGVLPFRVSDSVSAAAETTPSVAVLDAPPAPAAGITFSSALASDSHVKRSTVRILVRLAACARLFRSADGRFYAQVPVGERHEIYGLKSAEFRDWLTDGYVHSQPEVPSDGAVRRAAAVLEARARFDTHIPEIFVRVGRSGHSDDDSYYIDLGDPSGRAVEICASGWSVVERPQVHFRRPHGLLPLPTPSPGGSIDLLRSYVNLTETDFRLAVTWLTAALRPLGPYPIMVLHGEQGSAKSTLAKVLRLLIDPQAAPVLNEPESVLDMMVTALNGWLLVYDNLSALPRWLSDGLCQLVYGGGVARRKLFENDERSVIHAQRPTILAGIDEFVRRGDLRDRCVFLHLQPIRPGSRRTEDEFWKAWRVDYPRILAGVLDTLVGGLRELPSVHLKELPRMADHARWGEATGRALGWEPDSFASNYNRNRKDATLTELEGSPLGLALLEAAHVRHLPWSGPPAQLYAELTKSVGKQVAASAGWPKNVSTFGNELRRLAPQLRLHGLFIDFERRHDGRIVTLS